MKSSFKRNLFLSFGFSMLLLIISTVASYNSIRNLISSSGWVNHTNQVMERLERTLSLLKDAESGQRGFLLTGKEPFLEPYSGAYDSALRSLQNLRDLTADNPEQTKSADQLRDIITKRFKKLESLIQAKRDHNTIDMAGLEEGKLYMDEARDISSLMMNREKRLLDERIGQMNKFVGITPALILITAILSFIITIVSSVRIINDFEKRSKLQKDLEDKDEDIQRRINIIHNVANTISQGDYDVRVQDGGADGLGNLSFSLNKMAESLQYSFNLLSEKEWTQAGIVKLSEKMLGEYDMNVLTYSIIEFLANYTNSTVGAFYIEQNNRLVFTNGYAFNSDYRKALEFGEGISGQAAQSGKEIMLSDVPVDQVVISYATGAAKPQNVIAMPVFHERKIVGVFELAALKAYTPVDVNFLQVAAHNIGIILNAVENRRKLQELLEETQSQSEELQAQHNELENMNTELEAQAEKLQASEEELKVQQEELLEANQELEERSRMLEERNQQIHERNVEIQRKAEELALSTKYKSEFLANMSHELRTPLNSILLLSRLMSENNEKNLSNEQIEYAKVILSSGNGLLSLIDEILDLSKIEAGKMELQYSAANIKDMVSDLQSLFGPVAKEKNVSFETTVSPKVPQVIETDKMRLEQILKNLISNSLKFTSQGYIQLKIFIDNENKDVIVFSVKDTGIGISKDKQQLIFEAFQQADGSTRRKYGGTGLGLSISRELAKLLGGEIQLDSEPDQGSEFRVYLPLSSSAREVLQTTEITVAEEPAQPKETSILEETISKVKAERFIADVIPQDIPDDRAILKANDKVILIVEDDTNFAKSLLEFTRKKGYKGVVAVRGDEGVELAHAIQPTGILLDIQLPVKDGWEVMEDLKSDPSTRHIPVHIMSSYEVKNKSISKGAVDFINKPVAFDQIQEIFQKIEHVLTNNPRKVLIVEENPKHAKALAYFLETFNVSAEIKTNVNDSVNALKDKEVNCVILDMGVPDQKAYETLEQVKRSPGLENTPIIIFTGKSLSKGEEARIKKYADSIVIKTAHSYQRILDEVSLFLHLVEEKKETQGAKQYKNLSLLHDVLKGKTVLIADDDVRNIYSLTKSLENFNMHVISAMDGSEALKQLEANPQIDIVLMDMMMPEMDGYESTKRIKKNPRFRNLPVIAVTAKAMTGDREKCIAAGASDYITKPVDIDQLLSLLRVWLYDSGK